MDVAVSGLLLAGSAFAIPAIGGAGCGGSVVYDEDRGGAGGHGGESSGEGAAGPVTSAVSASASTTATTVQSSSSVGTGTPALCHSHDDCPGAVCLFATGTCVPSCDPDGCDTCGPGGVCSVCATTTTPGSNECVAACMPWSVGRCDDDDRCPNDEVCVFSIRYCAPTCDSPTCADPSWYCQPCATGSSCGDADCVDACFPVDG